MQRIDVASAAVALPVPSAQSKPGYFTEGNPLTGVPATIVTADFLNMLQEELISILDAAGITPSKTSFGQVLAALRVLFAATSSFSGSFGQSGYLKLPNGFILQWAFTGPLTNQALNTVSFPIQFPRAAFAMLASAGQLLTLTTNQVGVGAAPISTSQGQIAVAANASGQTGVYYFVIGN